MNFPQDFTEYTQQLFGEERWQRFINSFNEPQPVSIRLNPKKSEVNQGGSPLDSPLWDQGFGDLDPIEIPWCRNGYWLKERPDFTLDPLLHAGCYYVQEAGSMFLDHVIRQKLPSLFSGGAGGEVLDLCASPGGKSTLLRAALPEDCVLYSNEPDHKRANILMENMQKQGYPNVIVTNNYAKDYRKAGMQFDLILCDVPCSGEGMFRKDEGAIKEWSLQNVMKCQQLQRSIVEDIWPCLNEGGIIIYSTCTFNTREDEENVQWICENLGAEVLPVETKPEWQITGSLLEGWNQPVYRFIPGVTKTEGLFMAVLRKGASSLTPLLKARGTNNNILRVLCDGNYPGTLKGKTLIPDHAEALLTTLPQDKYPRTEVDLDTALHYLRGEALNSPLLQNEELGIRLLTYQGHPLGFVKNLGNRANNLYPQEWRIRKNI